MLRKCGQSGSRRTGIKMFEQLVTEILMILNVGKREDRTGLSRDLRFGGGAD
jgi:hypothetical protein